MEKLEMLPSFQKRFGDRLNPAIHAIKYCQHAEMAAVEVHFADDSVQTIDLKFMGGEIVKGEDGSDKDILPLFNPEADIVDNASSLLQLDEYSFIMCLDILLKKEAVSEIAASYHASLK